MATIKIVGEDWCPFTQGKSDGETAEKGAWLQAESLSGWDAATGKTGAQGADGTTQITYEKLDCGLDACTGTDETGCLSAADKETYCDVAQGFPSFMDADGNTCTRGFDRAKGFGGNDGITKTIQGKLEADAGGTYLCTA